MRQKNRNTEDGTETISLGDRVFTAIIAPIVFNISIALILSQILGKSLRLGIYHRSFWLENPFFFIGCVLLPALLGFVLGSSAFATMLGHFFYTNHESQRSSPMTCTVWLVLIFTTYLLSKV